MTFTELLAVPLLHHEGPLVSIWRNIRVMHLNHLNICINPGELSVHDSGKSQVSRDSSPQMVEEGFQVFLHLYRIVLNLNWFSCYEGSLNYLSTLRNKKQQSKVFWNKHEWGKIK